MDGYSRVIRMVPSLCRVRSELGEGRKWKGRGEVGKNDVHIITHLVHMPANIGLWSK